MKIDTEACNALELAYKISLTKELDSGDSNNRLTISVETKDFKYIGTELQVQVFMYTDKRSALSETSKIKWSYKNKNVKAPKFDVQLD